MGFLDAIIKPIESAVNSVENAVSEVVKLFGEAVRFLEDVVKEILDVISRIKQLFNESKIEYMFIHPFKEAALVALGDLDKLTAIFINAGAPSGVFEDLEYPVRSAIEKSKEGITYFENAVTQLINSIEDDIETLGYDIHSEYDIIFNDITSLPSYLDDFGTAVDNSFKVETAKAYKVIPEFDNAVETKALNTRSEIEVLGNHSIEPLTKFKQSVVNRIESESKQLDLLIVIVIALVLGSIIAVYYFTRSVLAVAVVAFVVVVTAIVVLFIG